MLDKSPVSGLVVPRVEAVLEYCRLDVVPFLALLKWNRLDLPSGFGLVYLVSSEVSPALLAFLVLDFNLPFVVFHGDGSDDLTRLLTSAMRHPVRVRAC